MSSLAKYLFILLSVTAGLRAQQYNFRHYSVKEGVAQSQVFCLWQDSRGYLWMGTRGGGLSRFDGTEFRTYGLKDGLPNNYVSCIREDGNHRLWIGTNNGLSEYNGIRFVNHYPANQTGQFSVLDMDADSLGRWWLATGTGVFRFQGSFENVSRQLNDKPALINTIHIDRHQNVWYGSAEGLFRISETPGGFIKTKYDKTQGFLNNSITCIREDNEGNIWIGTYGDGMYVYNGKRFSRIDQNLELYRQTVLDIYFDKRGNAWLATLNHGVAQYQMASKNFTWLTEREGLSNNHVRSILQDRSGNYWFGTSGGGVCHYFGKQFTVYDKSSGLSGNFIYSVFRDSRHRLWTGTSDQGLSVLDSAGFYSFNAGNGFANVKVKAIAESPDGLLYFGTDGQGVFSYDGKEFKEIADLKKTYVRALLPDKDGNLWIATAGTGLFCLRSQSEDGRVEKFTTKEGLLHNRLTALLYDKSGRLWYGTENSGIGCLLDGRIQEQSLTVSNGLPSNAIRCMAEDESGYLWLGTAGDGLASVPLYQGDMPVKRYNYTNGLSSSNIYLLCIDKSNNLFSGTETGLDHLILGKDRRPIEIRHYGKGEGFTGIETCQNAVYRDDDGTIWFGTINGLTKYNPANLVRNEHEPVTTINGVRLFFEPLSGTTYASAVGDWNAVSSLNLPHDQNHLTFDFLGINLSNPEAVKYQWILKGFDKDWSPSSNSHSFTYPNLGPGDYTFMVKACNEDGVWNRVPAQVTFHISAPFWMRWWFLLLTILTVSALLFFLFRWRVNRIRAKADEVQQKTQMEKEILELEQKALRLQMNPHFIFNALNSIQSQIGTDNEQAARYYLAKFSRLMRQILDNSRQSQITLEEEVHTLENYLLIEKFCNGNRFDYSIRVNEQLESDYIKLPPMLLQPFIENAIKHGLKSVDGKRGLIDVCFAEHDGLLECSVTDNGIGRAKAADMNRNSKETYHKSTALLVTQERLDLLHNDKQIRSLEIIDLYDATGNAAGTKVVVRIPVQ